MRSDDELRRFHEQRERVEDNEGPAPDDEREEEAPDEDAVREAQRRLDDEHDQAG
jgi:hypothetical protein